MQISSYFNKLELLKALRLKIADTRASQAAEKQPLAPETDNAG